MSCMGKGCSGSKKKSTAKPIKSSYKPSGKMPSFGTPKARVTFGRKK